MLEIDFQKCERCGPLCPLVPFIQAIREIERMKDVVAAAQEANVEIVLKREIAIAACPTPPYGKVFVSISSAAAG